MGYSLRTRSEAKEATSVAEPVVAKKPAAKKVAVKKPAAKKVTVKKPAAAAKESPKKVAAPKKAAPAKKATPAKAIAKASAPAKKASPAKKATPAKKAEVPKEPATKRSAPKRAAPVKAAVKKVAAKPKVSSAKAPKKIEAPIVTIEEISSPSLPEVEPIQHEEVEEVKFEAPVVEEVASSHIRFDDELEEQKEEFVSRSVKSEDFEALDDIQDDSASFDLYAAEKHESVSEDLSVEDYDEFDNGNFESIQKPELEEAEEMIELSPASKPHSAFDAFTSSEEPETYNWSKTGSTYYNGSNSSEEDKKSEAVEAAPAATPTVIANPFGFGFTATTAINDTPVAPSVKPLPLSHFSFNSHFQSVSSPLDKLCQLTSQAQPIETSSKTIGNSNNNNIIGTSSFLPTSPAAPLSKVSRSPSENGEEKEIRSPSTIQSIIVDDKHEDFSAF